MSGACGTVELEVPASRLVALTFATHSTGHMAWSKDTSEGCACVDALVVCVLCVINRHGLCRGKAMCICGVFVHSN